MLMIRLSINLLLCLASVWFKNFKEVANSVLSPGYMDLPIDAGMWLRHFKNQNSNFLAQLEVSLTRNIFY